MECLENIILYVRDFFKVLVNETIYLKNYFTHSTDKIV